MNELPYVVMNEKWYKMECKDHLVASPNVLMYVFTLWIDVCRSIHRYIMFTHKYIRQG